MFSSFEALGLDEQIVQAVGKMGFEQPTAIQQSAIPALLSGRNVVGQAQTGTGKTAAFVLPMLQTITPGQGKAQALVLAPTRELAIQVAEATQRMAQNSPVKVLAVYGGQPYYTQTRQLQRGVDVVVGTPGRLLDLIRQNVLDLSQVCYLVLDEADEMLEMGFIEDVEAILAQVTGERQIALFSATLPTAIRKLADKYVSSPEEITIASKQLTVAETEQRFCRVREDNKFDALTRFLEMEEVTSALIFARTKMRAQELADTLVERGYPAEALHGDLSQSRREFVLNRFRSHSITLLIATDVAARGLDIENVSHVFNFDVPGDAEDYVHRIGRTGRAGRKGVAITFMHPRDRRRLQEIEAYTHQKMTEIRVPTQDEIMAKRDERFIRRIYEQMIQGISDNDRALVAQLVESSVDVADIAAVAIKMARANEGALPMGDLNEPEQVKTRRKYGAEEASDRPGKYGKPDRYDRSGSGERRSERGSEPRRDSDWKPGGEARPRGNRHTSEAGMVRLRLNLGETHGLRPGDVVGAIASEVGIPGKAIGEIDIHRDHSFVDVSEKHVRKVLQASSGSYFLRGRPVILTLAA